MLNYFRDKNEGTHCGGEGEKGPLCDPGSELLLGGSARVVREKKRKKRVTGACPVTTELVMVM